MVFQQNTSDNDWVFINDKEKSRYEEEEIKKLIKRKRDIDADLFYNLKRKQEAEQKWDGKDTDRDGFNDGGGFGEIARGSHDIHNIPLHKPIIRNGVKTKGTAYVGGGGIQWDWDHSIVDIRLKPRGKSINGVHTMNAPRKMSLSVNFGDNHNHLQGQGSFKMKDVDVKPQNYRLPDHKIKNIGITKTMKNINNISNKNIKKSIGSEAREDKDGISDLSRRLTGFLQNQKTQKKSGKDGIKKPKLDFSIVGIVDNPTKKKIRGIEL